MLSIKEFTTACMCEHVSALCVYRHMWGGCVCVCE